MRWEGHVPKPCRAQALTNIFGTSYTDNRTTGSPSDDLKHAKNIF